MQILYADIVISKGMGYQDFLDELNHHFFAYSVTDDEYVAHIAEWKVVYGRSYELAYRHPKLIMAAFGSNQYGREMEAILAKVAYREISASDGLAQITGLKSNQMSLGNPVPMNTAELIVEIANQYGIFKENLTVSRFNDFMAGKLTTPLESNNNVAVALFVKGLKDAKLFHRGIYKHIGDLECILSSTGAKSLTGKEISTIVHDQSQMDIAIGKPTGKYKGLKQKMAALGHM